MTVVHSWERQTHWNITGSLEYLEARSSTKSIKYAEGRNAHLLLQRKYSKDTPQQRKLAGQRRYYWLIPDCRLSSSTLFPFNFCNSRSSKLLSLFSAQIETPRLQKVICFEEPQTINTLKTVCTIKQGFVVTWILQQVDAGGLVVIFTLLHSGRQFLTNINL